jgi:amino acid transporter
VSITIFSVFTWSLALAQSFAWNVTVSAVARLVYYAVVCMALPVLRAQSSTAPEFRLPAGNWLAALGTLLCLALLTRVNFSGSIILLLTVSLAFMNWLWVRNRAPHPSP